MTKLVVEVLDSTDLMPKDGQGSASPFVEVDFDQQSQRTQTKHKDLNPCWNEKLVFNVNDLNDLHNKTIDVVVYTDHITGGHHKHFLGRVRIYGFSVLMVETDANVQRYPLDKRGLFSHIKGDIALKIYVVYDGGNMNYPMPLPVPGTGVGGVVETDKRGGNPIQEGFVKYKPEEAFVKDEMKKKKKMEKEVRTFHSIGTGMGGPPPSQHHFPPQDSPFGFGLESSLTKEKAPVVETRTDFMRAGPNPTGVMSMMHMPRQPNPEFSLKETYPPVAARMRYRGGDMTSTYDLVDPMCYLYVNVVKARDLPAMDVSGSLDPYVEVKLGNYKGRTKHLEKNQNPVWNQVFAFAKERLQSDLLEVVVKDKDIGKDDFVGRVAFDTMEVPSRKPPDSPLAPQWYRLEDKKGAKLIKGEIMLGVWMGTQADEAFPEAWHSDAHGISQTNLANTRSKVYFSPKLYYLRVLVIEAQDLFPSDRGRVSGAVVKVQVGNQVRATKPVPMQTINPVWKEEFMFVVAEPFEDFIVVSVEEKTSSGKDEILGRQIISVRNVSTRVEPNRLPDPRWFNLQKPSVAEQADAEKKKERFTSKILLLLCLDVGYHVLDESTHFSSDLQPSFKHLRKQNIGILGLGIRIAKNLHPMKSKDGATTDAYCVAKYGNKWVRTRTILNTLHPRWHEQYSWEVYDPCTVITIGVFDNCHINGSKDDARDQRIGKVRIRLSTLETDRIYRHFYPLLVLTPLGLRKYGEIELALRFTCTAWVNMVTQYGKPLLPKMHYLHPIAVGHIDTLRSHAMQIVALRLARAEPPLRPEAIKYMLDVDQHMWSLRRSKANIRRIMSLLSGVASVFKWFNDICYWRNPVTTCLVHVLFLILVCYPELILPTIFLYLFVIGIWNYRFRPRHPPFMDIRLSQAETIHPDELDEEFDTFPTSRPMDIVRMRYDRMRHGAARVQTVIGDLASHGERAQAILSWRDPRATAIFIIFSLIWAVFIYITPFQIVAVLVGLYQLRHPRFRGKMPSVPMNFFKRLPSKSDMLL